MITVRLYGLLRLDSGIREMQMDASSVKDVLQALSDRGIPKCKLDGCVILINGISANKRSRLADSDTVVLMSPVAGG